MSTAVSSGGCFVQCSVVPCKSFCWSFITESKDLRGKGAGGLLLIEELRSTGDLLFLILNADFHCGILSLNDSLLIMYIMLALAILHSYLKISPLDFSEVK